MARKVKWTEAAWSDLEVVADYIAREIWIEWGEDQADTFSITAQPICPKCGELGRFSDLYCSECGIKLLPRTYLDIDTGELIFYPMSQGEHRKWDRKR
jgi:hypothetical protein